MSARAEPTSPGPQPAAKPRRTVADDDARKLAGSDWLLALARSDLTWAVANLYRPQGRGRPRAFHPVVYVLFNAALFVYGSADKVALELRSEALRGALLPALRQQAQARAHSLVVPFDEDRLQANWPPQQHHYRDAANTWLKTELDTMRELLREQAVAEARRQGLLDAATVSYTNPSPDNFIHGDGKVVTPVRKPPQRVTSVTKPTVRAPADLSIDELRATFGREPATIVPAPARHHSAPEDPEPTPDARTDRDAAAGQPEEHGADAGCGPAVHQTGDGPKYGWKFVKFFVRGPKQNSRLILDVARQDDHDEAALAVRMAADLAAVAGDGLQGVIYDTALRGRHITALSRDLGLMVLAPVAAMAVDEQRKTRLEKAGKLETVRHGDCVHQVWYYGGGVAVEDGLDHTGSPSMRLARTIRRERRASARHFRWYAEYEATCTRGGTETLFAFRLTHVSDDRDQDTGFNRAENLRLLDLVDPDGDGKRLYPRRSDAESANNLHDARRYLRRAGSDNPDRVLLEEMGEQLAQNVLSQTLFDRCRQPTAA